MEQNQRSLVQSTVAATKRLLFDPAYFWRLATLVILGDVVLTQLVIHYVRYTEIDYITYLKQIEVYQSGERRYPNITGPTGPLVYPAGHVLLHRFLHWALPGDSESPVLWPAQQVYGVLYTISEILACKVYQQAGGVPNYLVIFLALSKRLHSIYVLRMFNDCWTATIFLAALVAFNQKRLLLGSILYSAALSVKMNVLLYLPGLLVVFVLQSGIIPTLGYLSTIALCQAIVAVPFLTTYPHEYLTNAFEFSRVFLYKWTVNWRSVSEETFLSPTFARSLLAGHLITLIVFGFLWCREDGGVVKVLDRAIRRPSLPAGISAMSPDRITTILFTSNLIGIVFARSLHFQFYSWYAQQLPFLLWRTKFPIPVKVLLLGLIEYTWNAYPPSPLTSVLQVAANATIVAGLYVAYPEGKKVRSGSKKRS
ncbi:dolichyl-P-Man:Man(5)GlcNAc(2)-PP-dolichol alpha-1,3-mannosyltransferase [Tulasnella sp. 418]|nr:dolichyl-P-Man:Man(5)GlcNAc(2)-PP-dolichol alpha-1,3-mannosyltransferase [Tulasnella sp. 418]